MIHTNDDDSLPFRSANYHPNDDEGFHHNTPRPQHVTYGPARPVALRPQPLYHHGFALSRPKIPHLKDDRKRLSDAIYKYSTFVNHAKIADLNKQDDKGYFSGESDGPDYSVTSAGRGGSYRQPEGLSAYRNHHEDDEEKYRESIGDFYENEFETKNDYSSEKRTKPLPYSKLYFKKQHAYVPVKLNDNKYHPLNSYQNGFDDEPFHNAPSGFDDKNGGKVTPILARFYKQPLPVIQTRLPIDNVGGLYFQYFPIHRSESEKDFSNHFEHFAEERSSNGNLESSESQWTPINAPADAVPARSYDIPAPDLSRAAAVVNKAPSQHSEGVVSAVVRVKQ